MAGRARKGKLVSGYADTPACKLALYVFLGGWMLFGWVLGGELGAIGWGIFVVLSIALNAMPTVVLIEPAER